MNDDELDARIRAMVDRVAAAAPPPRPYPDGRVVAAAADPDAAAHDARRSDPSRRRLVGIGAVAASLVVLLGIGAWWVFGDEPDEVTTTSGTEDSELQFEVYLLSGDEQDCSAVEPVTHSAAGDDPLVAALTALLAGPTGAQQDQGLRSWFTPETAGMLNEVTIRDGVAEVDFADFSGVIPNASTSCGSAGILTQLDRTVAQFDGVDASLYSFDGDRRAFYEWLQLSPPVEDDEDWDTTTTTTTASTTTTTEPRASAPLPGERLDIFPYEGARVAVVGVESDDTLNVRAGPGVGFDVVAELAPLSTDAVATGHNRSLGGAGVWAEVTVGDRTGWANAAFLLQPGVVRDITTELFPAVADRPSRPTMVELGRAVAQRVASEEPPSRIVVSGGPRVGDLGEVTVDVVGLGDDSIGGERLRVFATPLPGGGGFAVRTVEATVLCSRGVTDEGLCL